MSICWPESSLSHSLPGSLSYKARRFSCSGSAAALSRVTRPHPCIPRGPFGSQHDQDTRSKSTAPHLIVYATILFLLASLAPSAAATTPSPTPTPCISILTPLEGATISGSVSIDTNDGCAG